MIIESEYIKIVEELGLQSRLDKLKEELMECGVAVCHFQDNKVKFGNVVEEMADISLLFAHIVHITGCEKEVLDSINYKRERFYNKFKGVLN